MRSIDPDSEEAQAASRQNDREVFALQMQAKRDAEHAPDQLRLTPAPEPDCDHGWMFDLPCGIYPCWECWEEITVSCDGDEGKCKRCASPAASPLCRVGHVVWNRHDIGLDGRCKRCGAGFGKERG